MLKYSIAAVALLASTSFALGDQMDRGDRGAGATNPASEHAPGQVRDSGSARDLAPGQMKEGQSTKDYAPGHQKDNSAARSDEKGGSARRSEDNTRSRDMKSEHNAKSDASDRNAKSDRDAARNERADDKTRHEQSRSENRKGNASTGTSEGTEGRSGGKGSITNISKEQRTRVGSVFSRHHVEPARNLRVSVNVGVALPHSVHLYPIPEDIVLIVPDYRGYSYIMLDDDRVAIVDPDTFEVVDIIVIA
jgi:hypothetical protein